MSWKLKIACGTFPTVFWFNPWRAYALSFPVVFELTMIMYNPSKYSQICIIDVSSVNLSSGRFILTSLVWVGSLIGLCGLIITYD